MADLVGDGKFRWKVMKDNDCVAMVYADDSGWYQVWQNGDLTVYFRKYLDLKVWVEQQ